MGFPATDVDLIDQCVAGFVVVAGDVDGAFVGEQPCGGATRSAVAASNQRDWFPVVAVEAAGVPAGVGGHRGFTASGGGGTAPTG